MSELILAKQLTTKTQQYCIGLESGVADILDLVTPTTAELLRYWFQTDYCDTRRFNFHPGQQQAIVNTIVAHEVLKVATLKDLYQAVAADDLLAGGRLQEVSQAKHAHPKYCLKMATGTGKTWVLQALLVWQLLNKTAHPQDERFTRQFLIVVPGLIVYDRLLDAFCGKLQGGQRDFSTSDIARYAELFIPEAYRQAVFGFVRGNVCGKDEIGLKATGNGMIAITNWHLLSEADTADDEAALDTPGATLDPKKVVESLLPISPGKSPGKSAGNSLDTLDKRFARGGVLDFLAGLPELLAFNDEAHHIHDFMRDGETMEVKWQKSLSRIAERKGRRFVQVDFTATPYKDVGSGKTKRKVYFPHIIVDFDLKTAMRAGLVKSLVLDKRKEIGALPLEFRAERDADGNPALAEGQRVMLRAGLQKLKKLEADFATLDPARHPKMLVVCEDTTVSPLVVKFLQDQGLGEYEVVAINSDKKGEVKPDEWAVVRERLFDVDRHGAPRVIVSVLMLREGFDVNNICVIVPLRSSQAQILLEQTIGRGLRLMWRENEFNDIKRENRERIGQGQEPHSLIDILSVVEHPAFQEFYDELMREGLAGTTDEDSDGDSAVSDLISVGLVDNFEPFDFAIPFILREADESLQKPALNPLALPPFAGFTLAQLKDLLGKNDVFASHDVQAKTRFGDYRVEGGIMTASGYNDFLARLSGRLSQALSQPITRSSKSLNQHKFPYLQINQPELAAGLDAYIRQRLFAMPFVPLEDENWRVLLLDPVAEHLVKVFAHALLSAESSETTGEAEVVYRRLSEVSKLTMREGSSLPVTKCIYQRLAYPARNGGLEQAFIEWAMRDASVEAFCKINEQKHDFARLRYLKDEGLPAFYSPDFLVRISTAVYWVENKAQQQTDHPNVQRKLKAAVAWCERVNALPAEQRMGREWHYVLLGESAFYEWRDKRAGLAELLDFARVRDKPKGQTRIDF
ncbi:MAG: DEAD/DEAH box helicase family protein [Candidatus Methylumidiphilus sp.]